MGKLLVALFILTTVGSSEAKYTPDWQSLDSRPLPSWYDEVKFGIFVHWGVFSVPSFYSEWFWPYWKEYKIKEIIQFMKDNYPPNFTYADFAHDFTAEFFDPDEWAEIFKASGAGYVVLTSKHGEGFPNWPSSHSFNWNAKAVGPNRDLVGDLANAVRNKTNLKFGTYYCMAEWLHPLYLKDKAANFTTQDFILAKSIPELHELVTRYKPDLLWADLAEDVAPSTYYNSKEFLTWLYNESPVKDTVVTNDRWGDDCLCKHGGYKTCKDKYNPGVLQNFKWENCMAVDRSSWGYRRNAKLDDLLTIHEIISTFASTISCGGNMLMNVGPTKDGKIVPVFEERLRQFGSWLRVNAEGIYSTKPWTYQKETSSIMLWYTMRKSENEGRTVFAILLSWPNDPVLKLMLPKPSNTTQVTMLGYPDKFQWSAGPSGQGVYVTIPVIPFNKLPCEWAWVIKMTWIDN